MGYSFIYWSQVHRAGEQIDANNTSGFLPATFSPVIPKGLVVPPGPGSPPQFLNASNDFWAQGVNFGLDYSF